MTQISLYIALECNGQILTILN